MNSHSINFHELTHVILHTGYCPPLSHLLKIEAVLRNEYEADILCLYANNTLWHLGVLIPNPYGYKPCPYSLPQLPKKSMRIAKSNAVVKYINTVNSLVDAMMSQRIYHPFYMHARNALDKQRTQTEEIYDSQLSEPRLDLYEDLFDTVKEWTLEPSAPYSKMSYTDYCNRTSGDRMLYDVADSRLTMRENDITLASYNDRLVETNLLFSQYKEIFDQNGSLCFKLPRDNSVQPMNFMNVIEQHGLSYCAVFGLSSIQHVVIDASEQKNILIINYDAEHG